MHNSGFAPLLFYLGVLAGSNCRSLKIDLLYTPADMRACDKCGIGQSVGLETVPYYLQVIALLILLGVLVFFYLL